MHKNLTGVAWKLPFNKSQPVLLLFHSAAKKVNKICEMETK